MARLICRADKYVGFEGFERSLSAVVICSVTIIFVLIIQLRVVLHVTL